MFAYSMTITATLPHFIFCSRDNVLLENVSYVKFISINNWCTTHFTFKTTYKYFFNTWLTMNNFSIDERQLLTICLSPPPYAATIAPHNSHLYIP